jgi:hypothetical protein
LTTPTDAPILNERWLHAKRKSPMALRSESAIAAAGLGRAMLEQHAELVAAEAGQRVALAQARPQQRAHWRSSSSPAAWPHVSLTTLNSSRSR